MPNSPPNANDSLAAVQAELAELRAALTEQRATIERLAQMLSEKQTTMTVLPNGGDRRPTGAPGATPARLTRARRGTSRRGLLRGAAAATAAAVATSVAVSTAKQAHAEPSATGGNFLLGESNDASATTTLSNTTGSTLYPVLAINSTGSSGEALVATTDGGVALAGHDTSIAGVGGAGVVASSVLGLAVSSSTNSGIALYGEAGTGQGLHVGSDSGVGAACSSSTNYGVQASSGTSAGVWGSSNSSYGLSGSSISNADVAASGTGRIFQAPQEATGAPISGTFARGESIRDLNGDLWLCILAGPTTATNWVKVAHLAPGATSGGAITYLSKPIRLLDTRVGESDSNQTNGHAPCSSASPTTVNVASVNYNSVLVPANAVGAIGNVTVTSAAGGGYLEVVPTGAGFTGAANLAFGPGQTISNAFNVGLSGGNLDIIIGGANVDVIVDLFAIVV